MPICTFPRIIRSHKLSGSCVLALLCNSPSPLHRAGKRKSNTPGTVTFCCCPSLDTGIPPKASFRVNDITMAEFFGILASIISLVSTSTKLSTQLSQFIDGFRSAPRDSQSLARELQELCSTLDRLWRIFSSTVPRENSPLLDLRDVLASCGQRLEELEKLVEPLAVRKSDGMIARKLKKWKWNFQEKEVVALRNQLEIHKATLGVTLLLST